MTKDEFNTIFNPGQTVSAIRGDGEPITGKIEGPAGEMAWTLNGQEVVIISGEAMPIEEVREI